MRDGPSVPPARLGSLLATSGSLAACRFRLGAVPVLAAHVPAHLVLPAPGRGSRLVVQLDCNGAQQGVEC